MSYYTLNIMCVVIKRKKERKKMVKRLKHKNGNAHFNYNLS